MSGPTFFDHWDFWSEPDPVRATTDCALPARLNSPLSPQTHGFVKCAAGLSGLSATRTRADRLWLLSPT